MTTAVSNDLILLESHLLENKPYVSLLMPSLNQFIPIKILHTFKLLENICYAMLRTNHLIDGVPGLDWVCYINTKSNFISIKQVGSITKFLWDIDIIPVATGEAIGMQQKYNSDLSAPKEDLEIRDKWSKLDLNEAITNTFCLYSKVINQLSSIYDCENIIIQILVFMTLVNYVYDVEWSCSLKPHVYAKYNITVEMITEIYTQIHKYI